MRAIDDGLARIALAVLEDVLQRPPIDAAAGIDLVEGEIKALFPLRAVLRVLPGQRPGDADVDGLFRRGLGLRPIWEQRERRQHKYLR